KACCASAVLRRRCHSRLETVPRLGRTTAWCTAPEGQRETLVNLHSAGHRRGVACAPHAAAVDAGRAILAEGGNALEARVTMAATIAAVYPHMSQSGGDGFWLIREPSGRVRALMAGGPAGANASVALYREQGHDEVPARGPLAALTVPGSIGGWMLALEAARALGAKLPLVGLLPPRLKHAPA